MSNEWYDIDSWQWVDNNDAQWGFSGTIIVPSGVHYAMPNQIWTDDSYVYIATISGLDIVSIETEERQSFIIYEGGCSTVWSDNTNIFVGTTTFGIKYFSQSDIGPEDITSCLMDYVMYPDLTSDIIRYIHGNSNKLICCTVEGVDIIRRDTHYITHSNILGVNKCFVTPNHDYYYYTVSGTVSSGTAPWYLYRLNGNKSDWTTPDIVYTTGSGFLLESSSINDIYVTEHTSISGLNNTVFVATDDGVHVYDEYTTECVIYRI